MTVGKSSISRFGVKMETFLDLVREVANRLQCAPPDEDEMGAGYTQDIDLMHHRYEAFAVLWTVVKDDDLMWQLQQTYLRV